jgi:hypothetical protein
MHGHTPVAASFNERKNGMIKFSGVGVLDASLEYFKMGCIRVLYYFMMDQYDKEQIDTVHFGGTSAILSDGLTQFKNTLRAFPAPDDHFKDGTIWLVPLTRTVALKKVLGSNPFILVNKGQCYRAVFMASTDFQKKKQFLSFMKRYRLRKLAGTKIFCWDDPAKFQNWIEEENLDDYQLIPIGEAMDYTRFL